MQTGLGKVSASAREEREGDRERERSNWKNSQQLYANEVFLKLPKSAAKCRQKKKKKRREEDTRRGETEENFVLL